MGSGLTAAGIAALALAGAALTGCTDDSESRPAPSAPPLPRVSSTTVADPGPLPPPEALADVMNRLADPAVPGTDKLALVQNAAPPDAAILDQFSAALRDGGFSPVVFKVTDVRWADQPGAVLAVVTVSTTNPANPGEFSFPMEFRTGPGGWQLTRETAEMLLAFGNARQPGR
jgi:uncharacterized lipoprotein YbaY